MSATNVYIFLTIHVVLSVDKAKSFVTSRSLCRSSGKFVVIRIEIDSKWQTRSCKYIKDL